MEAFSQIIECLNQRTVDMGAVNQDEAQSLGFTGPCIRTSGFRGI